MIVLIRCNDIISDSRAKKYLDFYKKNELEYRIIAWDRLNGGATLPYAIYNDQKSKYGQGGFKAVIDRIKWMVFVYNTLKTFKCDLTIHACDVDSAFPAVMFKRISKYHNRVVFDVFDWFSDTLYRQGKFVLKCFSFMEKKTVKDSDHIIICEEERKKQIPYDINKKCSVMQNIPSFLTDEFLYKDEKYAFNNEKLTLSYVGGFSLDRCLDMLIEKAELGLFNLLIAGFGHASISQRLEIGNESPYIKYFEKVPYQEGLRIMYNSDIIYAMYSKRNPNHYYAAPNKFYEAMFVGKPLITTEGIIVAEKVHRLGIGYIIGEKANDLEHLIQGMTAADISDKASKSKLLWNHYKGLTANYLNGTYSSIIGIK